MLSQERKEVRDAQLTHRSILLFCRKKLPFLLGRTRSTTHSWSTGGRDKLRKIKAHGEFSYLSVYYSRLKI